MYICTYICIHIIHVYIYIHMQTHIYIYIHKDVYMHIWAYMGKLHLPAASTHTEVKWERERKEQKTGRETGGGASERWTRD